MGDYVDLIAVRLSMSGNVKLFHAPWGELTIGETVKTEIGIGEVVGVRHSYKGDLTYKFLEQYVGLPQITSVLRELKYDA